MDFTKTTDFHHFASAHQALFKKHGNRVIYKKSQLLVGHGESSPWMFFLETGRVKLVFASHDGEERILGFFFPGMTFAQSGAFYSLPHMDLEYEAYAGDCVVWRIKREEFFAACKKDKAIYDDWYVTIHKNQDMLIERILYLGEREPRRRIIGWLLGMTRYYSNAQPDGSVRFAVPMTQDAIASFVHLGRESVNKVLGELKSGKIISVKNHYITVRNLEKLRTELSA